jgi:ABC-type sugar transport system ATPase subunit
MGSGVIRLRGVQKRFGGTQALRGVDLDLLSGEIHALVGENGAGKSTVGKIMAGVYRPDAGSIQIEGRSVSFRDPAAALKQGIAMISQEITLVHQRTVLENVFLGVDTRRSGGASIAARRARLHELAEWARLEIDPDARVGLLNIAAQQRVEVLRALARDARLIVFDEPTAALSSEEALQLRGLFRRLSAADKTVLLVSHHLEEVLAVSDRVTVLRDGAVVETRSAKDGTPGDLVRAMLGRDVVNMFPQRRSVCAGQPVLEVSGLSAGVLHAASFSINAGEILGVAGLLGSGRSQIARALAGVDQRRAGSIVLDGTPVDIRSPRDATRHGIVMVPESRKTQGLVSQRDGLYNCALPSFAAYSAAGVVRRRRLRRDVVSTFSRVALARSAVDRPSSALSGGNQQKILFARSFLLGSPRVLIADEPTRGVDVGAKEHIYQMISEVAAAGGAVLLISSEIEEILGMADRVIVMRAGTVVAEFLDPRLNKDYILRDAFGAAS